MQGWWLQSLESELAARLHDASGIRPYALGVWPLGRGHWRFECAALSAPVSEVLARFVENPPEAIMLRPDAPITLIIADIRFEASSYAELLKTTYETGLPRGVEWLLEFYTPTAFKQAHSNDVYPIPDPRLLYQSALTRWNAFYPEMSIVHDDLLLDLFALTRIARYELRTAYAEVHGHILPGATGRLGLRLLGSADGRKLASLLLNYLSFAGAGIKCAMGMGRLSVTRVEKKSSAEKTEQGVLACH